MKRNLFLSVIGVFSLFNVANLTAQSGLTNLNFETTTTFTGGCNSSTVFPTGFKGTFCSVNGFPSSSVYSLSPVAQSGSKYISIGNLQTCGMVDLSNAAIQPLNPNTGGLGNPYTSRPTSFCGYYRSQGLNPNTDTLFVLVYFIKNGATIGKGKHIVTSNQGNWTNFCANITYTNALNPDSVRVRFVAAKIFAGNVAVQPNSQSAFFDIDNCSFSFATSVNDKIEALNAITLLPNPSSHHITITVPEFITPFETQVYDVSGKQISSQKHQGSSATIAISDLAEGVYFIKIVTDQGIQTRRVVVVRT